MAGTISAIREVVKSNRRWTTVGMLSWIIVVDLWARSNLGIAIPLIRHDFFLTNLQVGMIFAAFQLSYGLSHVPMGLIVDRFGARRVVLVSGLAWTVCAAATGLATSLTVLLIMRVCLGIAESPVFPAGIKIVDSWFPNREKAMAVASYEVAVQVGFAGAPLVGALLLVEIGWRLMFIVMALLSLIPLFIWFIRYQQPEDDRALTPKERALIMTGRKSTSVVAPTFGEWGSLFTHIQPWAMIAGGISSAIMTGFYLWLPIYLQQTRHFSVVHAGGSITLFGLAGIVGVIIGALLSDFLISRGGEVLASRQQVLVASLLLGGAAIYCTSLLHSNTAILATITLGYLATGLGAATGWALVPAVAPNAGLIASLGSLQNGSWQLGQAIAPLAIGILLDKGFEFKTIMAISAGFALISATAYGVILRSPIEQRAPVEGMAKTAY